MQPSAHSVPFWLAHIRGALLLLALGSLFAACDRHSAAEVPESYGHGSSHEKSYGNHQIDSRDRSASFSDTHGVDAGKEQGAPPPHASPAQDAMPARRLVP